MAEFFDVQAKRALVLHTRAGFLVFNEGKTTKNVPEEYRARLVRDGVIDESESDPLDHDQNGEKGGSLPHDPPSLTGKNKAELLAIAEAEGVEANAEMTNAAIIEAIEDGREASEGAPV